MTGDAPGRRTKQGLARGLAFRCYLLGCTAQRRPYANRGDARYFLDSKGRPREDLRADLRDAWQSDEECPSDPPSDSILNTVIADMRRAAEKCEPDPPTSAEVAADMVRDIPPEAFDQHPDRLKVHSGGRNPFDVAREVADYLLKANEPPRLFAMGPAAAVLLRDDGTLDALDQDSWLAYVAERVDFLGTNDGQRMVAPPVPAMRIVVAIILRELPQLDGVTSTPYLDADGNLISGDGYNPATRLYLRTEGLVLPPVSDAPTSAEVAAAVGLLGDDWLADFPFASPADKANAVAELLTITGRELFPLAPMFVHDASAPGSGKGLLLNTISIIATGGSAEVMELPSDGEEQRKTITSVLLTGKLLVAWDELHVIAGRTLAAILTAEIYSGRILSTNKLATVRNKLVQIALGNNVETRGDMHRRVVPSRLVPDTDHPEQRTGFRHPNLQQWVRDHRAELLAAAFTIWRHWMATGRREADVTMGSFERWAHVIGGALQAAGIEGFLSGTSEWLSYSEEDDGWPNHLVQLRNRFGGRWFTASEVAGAVNAGYLKRPPVKRDPDKELALQIAYAYRGQRERLYGDLRLIRSKERDSATGGRTWAVRKRGESEEDAQKTLPARPGADSSSGSSASSETAGQSTNSATDHRSAASDDHQEARTHRQDITAAHTAKSPVQRPVAEDTDDPDDGHRPALAADFSHVTPMRWRSDDTPTVGDDPDGGRGRMTKQRRTPPEDVRKIVAQAQQHVPCDDCGATPGQPCIWPGNGRTVHKSRYISAAIEMKHALKAAARTLEQQAILTSLPKVPKAEIEKCRTARGGYSFSRSWFLEHGLPYPPPAGWRQAVEREDEDVVSK